jgi:competence protein ComEC
LTSVFESRGIGQNASHVMHEAFKQFITNHWLMAEPWHHHVYRLPLLFFAILFCTGTAIGLQCPWLWANLFLVFGLAGGGLFLYWHRSEQRSLASLAGFASVFSLGLAHGIQSTPRTHDALSQVAGIEWTPCAMRVQVRAPAVWQPNPNHRPRDPNSSAWKTTWEVQCDAIRDRDQWQPVDARCNLSTVGRIETFLPGDVIEVLGHYRKITPATNPGGFDFAEFSSWESKYVMLRAESVDQLKHVETRWGLTCVTRLRGQAILSIDRSLSRWVSLGQAPLAAALVFGQRQQVDWQDQQELMATGTLHMLAISGLHVEIIASVLLALCVVSGASNRTTFFCLFIATWAYSGLAGSQPPVVRAAVQVSVFALARWIGAKARLGNLLGAAAAIVVMMQASNLSNVGVQLSFLAVATIGLFVSSLHPGNQRDRLRAVVNESLPRWRRWLNAMVSKSIEMLRLSWWVSLFTCPLIWSNFNVISPIAVPLNVLISLPVTVGLLSGLLTGIVGWFPPLGWAFGQICGLSLFAVSTLVTLAHQVEHGYWWLPAPTVAWTIMFYCIVLLWLLVMGRRWMLILAGLLVAWITVGVAPWMSGPRGHFGSTLQSSKNAKLVVDDKQRVDELRCTFLNVGHGTCVMLELPTGHIWLYDAGHLGSEERSHQEIAASLWHTGTARIDHLVLSHADSDHYNASLGLLERFSIGCITSTNRFWESSDLEVETLIGSLRARTKQIATWGYPDSFAYGEVRFQVLHPSEQWRGANDNANSLCLQIEYGGRRILLPGDLEGAGLTHLATLPERPCDVVMAPHHGSMTHDPTHLLQWCQAKIVVISGGPRANRPEVIQRYSVVPSQLAITHRDGAVQVRIASNGELSLWHWRKQQWELLE